MNGYFLIASRDPLSAGDVESFYSLAANLAARRHPVTLFLVQNGVLPARGGVASERLNDLARSGVRVLAEDFSLRERGIDSRRLVQGVQPAPIDAVVDALADGARVLWT